MSVSAATAPPHADATLLKSIYALVRVGDDKYRQHVVEMWSTSIVMFHKVGDPRVVYDLLNVDVFDEGDRDFTIELRPIALAQVSASLSQDDAQLPNFSSRSSSRGSGASLEFQTDDEAQSKYAKTPPLAPLAATDTTSASTRDLGSLTHHDHVPLPHGAGNDQHYRTGHDGATAVRVRCGHRVECLEMLQCVEDALHNLRLRSAGCQVTPGDLGLAMVAIEDLQQQRLELDKLRRDNERLRSDNANLHSVVEHLRDENDQLSTMTEHLRTEHDALLALVDEQRAEINRLRREADDATNAMREKCAAALAEAKRRLEEKHAELQHLLAIVRRSSEESEASAKEREALRRQLADALQKLKKRPVPQLNGAGAIVGLEQLLRVRKDHASWLRHHLCAVQIARFALSLKRASQILAHIPGSAQFSKEFSHDWPIASRLIELPAMVAEEDRMLNDILITYHNGQMKHVLHLQGSPNTKNTPPTIPNTHGDGEMMVGSHAKRACAAPACGGVPQEAHTCAAFTVHHDDDAVAQGLYEELLEPGRSLSILLDSSTADAPPPDTCTAADATVAAKPLRESIERDEHHAAPRDPAVDSHTQKCMDQCSAVPTVRRFCCDRLARESPQECCSRLPKRENAGGIRVFLRENLKPKLTRHDRRSPPLPSG